MASITQTQSSFLRNALRGNGLFSAVSGLITALAAGALVKFIGAGNNIFYIVIGIGLLFHAANLFFNTRSERINPCLPGMQLSGMWSG